MKNWKNSVKKYALESRNFDNADGSGLVRDSFIGQNNYIGESYANGQNAPMGGDVFSYLNDGNKYYTAVITNTETTGDAITAIVFGANQYSGSTQANAGVTVTIQESSHAEARAASQTEPFWVNGLRYRTSTTSQINNQVLTIQKRTSNGEINSVIFRPLSFLTSYQQQSLQVDAPGYKFLVDGNTSIQVPVEANTNCTLIMQLGGRFNAGNAVQGQSALAVANQKELATGLVQVVK
jgi:hypothetical protein